MWHYFVIKHNLKISITLKIILSNKLWQPKEVIKGYLHNLLKKYSAQNIRATISKLSMGYHNVKHHQTYNNCDCPIKPNAIIYNDFSLVNKFTADENKSSSLAKPVLGPIAIKLILCDFKKDIQETKFFSISSDASNRGDIKLFPLVVNYFISDQGIKNKILGLKSALKIKCTVVF